MGEKPVSGAEAPPSPTEVPRSNGAYSTSPVHRGENEVKVFDDKHRVEIQGQGDEAMSIGEYYRKKCRERTKNLEKKWREIKLAHMNLKVIAVGKKMKKCRFVTLLKSNCRGRPNRMEFFQVIENWADEKGITGKIGDRKEDEDGPAPSDDEDA